MRMPRLSLALAAALTIGAASGVSAGDWSFHHGHGYYPGYGAFVGPYAYGGGAYGFADAGISGAYIGAPQTRFPRPSELVPSALGYGTYGVPTVTGIRQAPAAQPTVYVIDRSAQPIRERSSRPRLLTRRKGGKWVEPTDSAVSDAGGARVVSLSVQ